MQGVYWWKNLVNGKAYIGSSTDMARRKSHHIAKLKSQKHPNPHLQAAWLRYGSEAFEFEVLEIVDDLIWLRAREQAWISRLNSCDRNVGYNITSDAWAPVTSPETIAKMKKAWVARKARSDYYKFTPEDQEKSRQASTGRPWSEKQRAGLLVTRKSGWTSERRAAQSERARLQKIQQYKDPNERKLHGQKIERYWARKKAVSGGDSN